MAVEIDIENTCLTKEDIKAILSSRREYQTSFHKGAPKRFNDFGIVLIGEKPDNFDDIMSIKPSDLIFKCPQWFTQAHIASALGAFKSVTAARKNGFDKEVEQGMSDIQMRINKVKGVVSVWKS